MNMRPSRKERLANKAVLYKVTQSTVIWTPAYGVRALETESNSTSSFILICLSFFVHKSRRISS